MSPNITQGILFTIICETVLQDRLIHLLQKVGVSGYTIIPAQGAGSHGRRMGDIAGYNTNIQVQTVVTPEKSDQLLDKLDHFETGRALIAFRHKVEGIFG
jgi:nitrogen regulatory protein PII